MTVEEMLEVDVGEVSEGHSNEGSQLVGILTRSRDSHGAGPVEVHVAHLVGDPLELVRIPALGVEEDVV